MTSEINKIIKAVNLLDGQIQEARKITSELLGTAEKFEAKENKRSEKEKKVLQKSSILEKQIQEVKDKTNEIRGDLGNLDEGDVDDDNQFEITEWPLVETPETYPLPTDFDDRYLGDMLRVLARKKLAKFAHIPMETRKRILQYQAFNLNRVGNMPRDCWRKLINSRNNEMTVKSNGDWTRYRVVKDDEWYMLEDRVGKFSGRINIISVKGLKEYLHLQNH